MNREDFRVHTCSFFGHREIVKTAELKNKLYESIENLITNDDVSIFCELRRLGC